jgi:hypothetical protein
VGEHDAQSLQWHKVYSEMKRASMMHNIYSKMKWESMMHNLYSDMKLESMIYNHYGEIKWVGINQIHNPHSSANRDF